MSVSITSTPFKLGWAKNRNSYKMSCNTLVSNGSTGTYYLTCGSNFPAVGNHIVLSIDGVEYVFTIVSSAGGAYEISSVSEMFDKLRACWYFKNLFNFPTSQGSYNDATHMTIISKTAGFHLIKIFCTDADGNKTGYESNMFTWVLGQNGAGADPVYLKNYAVAAELEVVTNNNNTLTTHTVSGLVFQPDTAGNIEIPLDLLGGLVPQPDIPTTDPTVATWDVTTNMLLKYRLKYGEMWGDDVPLIQNWTQNPAGQNNYNFAFCGEEADRFSRLNLADWDDSNVLFSETNNLFRILGERSGETVRVSRSQAQYIYGVWYDPTLANSATKSVTVAISKGGGLAPTTTKTVRNGEIYRIPVGASANSVGSSVLYYDITLTCGGTSWTRRFIIYPNSYAPTNFLLQNKYGLLTVLQVPEVRREMNTEAEEMMVDRRRYLDITDDSETYTAVTALMTREEGRKLAMCVGQQFHYVQCGTNWLRISIEAGSFMVLDEAEDMIRVEFNYRFIENQDENITRGSMARSTGATLSDFDNQVVSFSDRTPATHNNIL